MTNEPDNENTTLPPSDNEHVFNPLAKYAIFAVITVSIIVTTAVMLDKQLNTASNNLAAIQAEIDTTQPQILNLAKAKELKTSENAADPQATTVNTAAITSTTTKHPEKTVNAASATQVSGKKPLNTASTPLPATPSIQTNNTEKLTVSSKKTTPAPTRASSIQTLKKADKVAARETNREIAPATNEPRPRFYHARQNNIAQNIARHERFMTENLAYNKAMRTRQKRNMAEMFHRMNTIDAERLQQLELDQRRQIAALREQLGQQQHIINATINRDKQILQMRRMAVQRAQQQRQYILNQI